MFRRTREIWYSLGAIAAITALYAFAYQQQGALPAAASLIGHGIGVVGIVFMLMTETLYSIRKRVADASWGSTAGWLRFHIFTGLVGPYMVLLHSAMSFRGLAGASMLLTAVVVLSGVVGRYAYTAAPHPTDLAAAPLVANDLGRIDPPDASKRARRGRGTRGTLAIWRSVHVPLTWALFATAFTHAAAAFFYATLMR